MNTTLFNNLFYDLHNFFYKNADPRIRDKLFMGSPFALISIYLIFVIVIIYVIPKFMEYRKPFSFKKIWNFTDILIFLMSGFLLVKCSYGWLYLYNWICQPIDLSDSFDAQFALEGCYQFLMLKFVYMLQSAAYALSKRKCPVATYILIHHALFPIMIWSVVNYYPGGHVRRIFKD